MAYTLVLPFYAHVEALQENVPRIREEGHAEGIREVLLAHNGLSLTPDRQAIVDGLCAEADDRHPSVRFIHTDRKGMGAGYQIGIAEAKEDHLILSADDMPFGYSDVRGYEAAGRPDFAMGSKDHRDAQLDGVTLKRKLATFAFKTLRRTVLGRGTPGDSQGSVMCKTSIAKALLPELRYDNYLSSLELATLHIKRGGRVLEVPVTTRPSSGTSISMVRDSLLMARGVIELRLRR